MTYHHKGARVSDHNTEIETKIIDINPVEVRKTLKTCGAKFVKKVNFKTRIFNKYEGRNRKKTLRLRSDGSTTTLTLKDWDVNKRKHPFEYETTVADFDTVAKIFTLFIGEPEHAEKTREIYTLGKAEITIDKYGDLPYYMEIEAPSEKYVEESYKKIGRPGRIFGNFSTRELYKHYNFKNQKIIYRRQYGIVRTIHK